MTNKNLVHIVAILDRSGSMNTIKSDTQEGFNAFVSEQKKAGLDCYLTLVQFDNEYETVYKTKPIDLVPNLTLVPRGSTALYDAIGRATVAKGQELAALPEEQRPGSVVVLILTDGFENASTEWTAESIKSLIEQQQNEYNWNFIFLGANQDAVLTAKSIGIWGGNALTYTGTNVQSSMVATASNISNYTTSIARGLSHGEAIASSAYTDEQREEAVQ